MSRNTMPASTPPSKNKSNASGMANITSPQMANLLNKTAAAAEEFKRLLTAEQQWAEDKTHLQQEVSKLEQDLGKQATKSKRLEELRASEVASWRKDREAFIRDKEAAATKITSLMRDLDLKAQAEARFGQERKSWAERVDRIEKIAADAKEDARGAGEEVSRLQSAYQELFAKSRQEKESLARELQLANEENADLRQNLSSVQEQQKATVAQVEALDRVVQEYRRTISQIGQEKEDLLKQISALQNESADAVQQLTAAEEALEGEKEVHAAALEQERTERLRQQHFFDQALSEAEAEARGALSQLHGARMKGAQHEREAKRLRDERNSLQEKVKSQEEAMGKERMEWEQTYQQLTVAIAAKEMEQDAAAAHLEVMLRSVVGGPPPPTDTTPLRGGDDSPLVAPSSTEVSESMGQLSLAPSERGREYQDGREGGRDSGPREPSRSTGSLPQFPSSRTPSSSSQRQQQQQPRDSSREGPMTPSSMDRPPTYQQQQRHPGDRYDDRRDDLSLSPPDQHEGPPSYGRPPPLSASSDGEARADSMRGSGGGSARVPRYMQDKPRDKTGATVSEVASGWDRGLRSSREASRDPASSSGRKSAWH